MAGCWGPVLPLHMTRVPGHCHKRTVATVKRTDTCYTVPADACVLLCKTLGEGGKLG